MYTDVAKLIQTPPDGSDHAGEISVIWFEFCFGASSKQVLKTDLKTGPQTGLKTATLKTPNINTLNVSEIAGA